MGKNDRWALKKNSLIFCYDLLLWNAQMENRVYF